VLEGYLEVLEGSFSGFGEKFRVVGRKLDGVGGNIE